MTTPGVDASAIIPIFDQLGLTLATLLQNVVSLVQEVMEVIVDILEGLISGLGDMTGTLGLGPLADLGF